MTALAIKRDKAIKGVNQCDQIWQHFSTLVEFSIVWHYSEDSLVFGQQ